MALARALIVPPDFLILDEPFSSLDPGLRKDAIFLLKKILEREKCPVLLISHSKEDIESLASQIFFIHKGSLVFGQR